jgi:hypothetical protein
MVVWWTLVLTDSEVVVVGDGDMVLLVDVTVGDECSPCGRLQGQTPNGRGRFLSCNLLVAHIPQRGEGPAVVLEPKE